MSSSKSNLPAIPALLSKWVKYYSYDGSKDDLHYKISRTFQRINNREFLFFPKGKWLSENKFQISFSLNSRESSSEILDQFIVFEGRIIENINAKTIVRGTLRPGLISFILFFLITFLELVAFWVQYYRISEENFLNFSLEDFQFEFLTLSIALVLIAFIYQKAKRKMLHYISSKFLLNEVT